MTSRSDNTDTPVSAGQGGADRADDPNKGAAVGFMILAALVTFVAYWMFAQGRAALAPTGEETVSRNLELQGFRADLWHLPDEALLGFVEIPAGQFLMGSNPAFDRQAYENERWSETQRQGRVDLPPYYLARYEVTVAQYQAFIDATGHQVVDQALGSPPDHPVTDITWTDSLAYCRWIESMLRDSAATPQQLRKLLEQGWQITLPTEAQWEKAARGTEGAIFPWGVRLQENSANFDSNSTLAVGSYDCPQCNYGLADMSGNVWELTRSPYQPYPYNPDDDRVELSQDALWVMRGGSYSDGAGNIRAAVRGAADPGVRNPTIGFRLALTRM